MDKCVLTHIRRLGDLKQDRSGLQVSDLEAHEVHIVHVLLGFTEIPCREEEEEEKHEELRDDHAL